MLFFIGRRLLTVIPFLIVLSIVVFVLIQLPPGDYLDAYAAKMAAAGDLIDPRALDNLRRTYGLDESLVVQYWKWITNILQGDFGISFEWQQPVSDLVWGRMGPTLLVTILTLLFTWIVAFPIGIYSAVRRNSAGDIVATIFGYLGLATPSFLFALVILYVGVKYFGTNLSGFYSQDYVNAPWSWDKFVDLLSHLWVPILVLGTSGTASLIRIMRANLLDELNQPYVTTARAKGLSEFRLLLKYPVRIALNPFISTIGWVLPHLISGLVITAVVLNLPAAGPILLEALLSQDMLLAGGFLLLLCALTIFGTLISDVLLALLDPRIRYH